MREIRTSGLMSGEGKRGDWPSLKLPRPSSTLQGTCRRSSARAAAGDRNPSELMAKPRLRASATRPRRHASRIVVRKPNGSGVTPQIHSSIRSTLDRGIQRSIDRVHSGKTPRRPASSAARFQRGRRKARPRRSIRRKRHRLRAARAAAPCSITPKSATPARTAVGDE